MYNFNICLKYSSFSQWENSKDKYLLICNALPASWDMPQFAKVLPHWTVAEFFAELEKFMLCEFDIDYRVKHIRMGFTENVESAKNCVRIDKVIDNFTSEVSYEDDLCKYKGVANIRYADRGDSRWKLDQCQWLVDFLRTEGKNYREVETELDAYLYWRSTRPLYDAFREPIGDPVMNDGDRSKMADLVYAKKDDKYFLIKVNLFVIKIGDIRYCTTKLIQINRFGDLTNPDTDYEIKLNCIPVRIDYTDGTHGDAVFLAPAPFDDKDVIDSERVRQPRAYSLFLKGEQQSSHEYYDKLYLAYWDGHNANGDPYNDFSMTPPCPYVDERFSLKTRYKKYMGGLKVYPKEKLKVSFLSTKIPDVRSIFFIRGKKYLCEKITATFTENGMSQLLKGDFYQIVD